MTKISFAEFQERALYGPRGFFSENEVVGKRGDFVTSPSLGTVFAEVLGNALDAWWSDLGEPSRFEVFDCGGADGALARAVGQLDLRCRKALRYTVVERSAAAIERLTISNTPYLRDFPAEPVVGVVIANELLDNIPVSLFEYTGNAWREICYDERSGTEMLREVLPVAAERLQSLVEAPRPGARAPLQTEARGWVAQALEAVERGRVVCIDYARTTAEMARLDQHEWLRTYRNHQPGSDPYEKPGSQDITCDVASDQLPAGAVVSTQAEFLRRHGIDAIRGAAVGQWEAGAADGGFEALAARSKVGEVEALVDPGGLGGFTVFEWIVH
jgi:SAM-dependent MidA family methyltransferase